MTDFQNIRVCLITNRTLDGDYIEEWCEHYYNLGFSFIYILEDINGSDYCFADMPYIKDKVDSKLMLVEQIPHQNQWKTYPEFYEKYKSEFEWCAIFDSDEFLILNKHNTIQDFLNDPILDFSETDTIQICWRYYMDNNQVYKSSEPVMTRFTELALYDKPTIETKILVRGNLSNGRFFIGHTAVFNNQVSRIKFCDGSIVGKEDPYHVVDYTYAALNHYQFKSTEEFIERKRHGRIDIPYLDEYKTFKGFVDNYYKLNERTPEKDKMFDEVLSELKKEHYRKIDEMDVKRWRKSRFGNRKLY